MKSSSQHSFAVAPQVSIPRSSFRRNSTYKTTFNAGYLNCVHLDEVLPGDTFNFKLSAFMRILSPLKYPIMDNLYCDLHAYFVPIRLVWADYEKFFGSSKGPEGNWEYDDSIMVPGITPKHTTFAVETLADQFGLPTEAPGIRVNVLPFRAYNRIVADWYRPSTYELPMPKCRVDTPDDDVNPEDEDDYPVAKRLKRCDYFTSALIAPQRGPGVELPLGAWAPVVGDGTALGLTEGTTLNGLRTSTVNISGTSVKHIGMSVGAYGADVGDASTDTPTFTTGKVAGVVTDPEKSGLRADLSSATAATINSLRQAFQLQRALERDERGGVRYVSQLMSHFGVRSPDARLQRTEYLGGCTIPINIHTVANTGNDTGALRAFAVAGEKDALRFVKSFTEHGYILVLASVRADLTYQQGIPRMFDRFARFDFYYPVFAHLGEQFIKNKEIFAQGPSVTDADGNVVDEQPFGYQERFAEYRYSVSKITGLLRSAWSSLDAWHLAQEFKNLPVLNDEFLAENVPMSRVKAITSGPDFVYDSLIECNCVRPMPLFGVPGLVDHF